MAVLDTRAARKQGAASLAAYAIVFAVAAYPWWSRSGFAVSVGNDAPRDMRLIVWILGWVSQALAAAPTRLFDAPTYYPAPSQLAGSEHFLSSQIAFAPLYWLTGNAVRAANGVALLSYPAAAFAMDRLLVALGVAPTGAWLGGLGFALARTLVPASLQVLQYLAFFLPITAGLVQRVRERSRGTAALAAVLLLAMLSSYYMAVLIAVTAGLWSLAALTRPERGRIAFLCRVGAALAVASLTLAALSGPYLRRSESVVISASEMRDASGAVVPNPSRLGPGELGAVVARVELERHIREPTWLALSALAALGAVAGLRAGVRPRQLALAGIAFAVAGVGLMMVTWPAPLGRWLSFFRARSRYLLLSSFGASALVALGFEAATRAVRGRAARAALLAAAAAALLGPRLAGFVADVDPVIDPAHDPKLYRALASVVNENGRGPLLEVPYVSNGLVDTAPDAMVGQLVHGLPLIVGFTGHRPDHHGLVQDLISALPEPPALDDLVDATHLRWILVRPAGEWWSPAARARLLAGLARYPEIGPAYTIGPWELWRIDRVAQHPKWFAALAAGPTAGESLLGAPLDPIPEAAARAVVLARPLAARVAVAGGLPVDLYLTNLGTATWPAWAPESSGERGLVQLEARWERPGGTSAANAPTAFRLRRDVDPGESIQQRLAIPAPTEPGTYELVLALAQRGGAAFIAPGNVVARLPIEVEPRPSGAAAASEAPPGEGARP